MKGLAQKAFVLAIGVVIMLTTGCEEDALSTNTKKSRLIAAENLRLKEELQQCEKERERQKELCDKKIKRQEELLANCQQEKTALQKQLGGEFEKRIDEFLGSVGEESAKLHKENESLKAQIEKLKKEIEELKKAKVTP